jgi:multicomponent K+:H+ antiporter subunit D
VLISSGTVLAAIGMGQSGVTGGALFYLVSSTLGISAFFLLIELVERGREPGADMIAMTREAYGEEEFDESVTVGIAIPATMGVLGLAFIGCAVVIAGLPPLSGFIGKFALLSAVLGQSGPEGSGGVPGASWALLSILILSGFAVLIAMTRAGIRAFWASPDRAVPRVLVSEIVPVATLLVLCAMQTVQAGAVMRFMDAAAHSLHTPQDYIREVQRPPGQQAPLEGGS